MTTYALRGETSRELLTYGGRVLVHSVRAELEFLIAGAVPVALPSSIPAEQTLPIRCHPELINLRWPLQRKDFK